MNDLDLYRRIEYPNETRQSWAVERKLEGMRLRVVPLHPVTADDAEEPAA